MSKQDRTYPRTAADLERKYNFGRNFSEILGVAKDAQTHAYNAEASVKEWSQRIVGLEGNYAEIKAEQDRISLLVQSVEGDYSEIIQTQESITAKVGELEGNYSNLTQTVDGISAEVVALDGEFSKMEQTVEGISTRVGALDGKYSTLEQTVDGISTNVTDLDSKYSTISQNVDGISAKVGALEESNTEISAELALKIGKDENGNLIGKVYIGADQLTIDTDNFTLTEKGHMIAKSGEIAGWNIGSDSLSKSFTDEDNNVYNVIISAGLYEEVSWSTSFFVEKNSEPQFYIRPTGELFAKHANVTGVFCTYDGDDYAQLSAASLYLQSDTANGKLFLNGKNLQIMSGTGITIGKAGVDGYLYGTWYLTSGEAVTSDENYKHEIIDETEAYSVFFDSLRPVLYKYKDGTSDRYHAGFIAQEVNEALTNAGLTRKDFAGICITDEGTKDEMWALRYTEFVSLNTYEIQKLKKEVAELKARIGA